MSTESRIHDILLDYFKANHQDEVYSLLPTSTFSFVLSMELPEEIRNIFLQEPEQFTSHIRNVILDMLNSIKSSMVEVRKEYAKLEIKLVESKLIKLSEIKD